MHVVPYQPESGQVVEVTSWRLVRDQRNEGNVLFYDLWLYDGHIVEDHTDSERRHPLPPHGLLLFLNRCKGSLNSYIEKLELFSWV